MGVERQTFYELVLSYYRARNHLCGAQQDIDVLRRESSDTVDKCWNTVDDLITLQVSAMCWSHRSVLLPASVYLRNCCFALYKNYYYIRLTATFRTTWVSRYQKGRTILDFNEARDDGVAAASAGPYANHLHLAPDR